MTINPTLASTLLELELDYDRHIASAGGGRWRTGIKSLDKDLPWNLWQGGRIYGIGEIAGNDLRTSMSCRLPLEILSTHILDSAARLEQFTSENENAGFSPPISSSVYIITPPSHVNSTIQSLHQILTERLRLEQQRPTSTSNDSRPSSAHKTALSPEIEAENLLAATSILPTLDLPGLADSVSEVSSSVSGQATDPQQTQRNAEQPTGAILLIRGLNSILLSDAQRRSGTAQTAALLSSVLGSLRHLSRTRSRMTQGSEDAANPTPLQLLVLVELDISSPSSSSSSASHGTNQQVALRSAFATSAGGPPFHLATPMSGVLGRLVLDALDTVVAVHDGDGKVDENEGGRSARAKRRIVEVVSDVAGNAYGNWAVWEGEGGRK